jgi:hypothetical protein
MFMIERVTRLQFPKDGMHMVYKIEKTHLAKLLKGWGAPMLMRIFQSLPALGLRGVASGRRLDLG